MLNEGDEVILPCPYWVSYSDIVKLNGGIPVEVKTSIEHDFKMTPAQLEAAITPKTKMIWYSSPCNPSGSVYSKDELELWQMYFKSILISMLFLMKFTNILTLLVVIVVWHSLMICLSDTITVNGVSKAFAMTGWRIGYIGAPDDDS